MCNNYLLNTQVSFEKKGHGRGGGVKYVHYLLHFYFFIFYIKFLVHVCTHDIQYAYDIYACVHILIYMFVCTPGGVATVCNVCILIMHVCTYHTYIHECVCTTYM